MTEIEKIQAILAGIVVQQEALSKNYPYGIEAKLLAITPDAEELIDHAGRVCYNTDDKEGTDPDRIQKWIKSGHESVIEHPCATFEIIASRILTHELVRHRIASYSQRSQRYVNESKPDYIIPPELNPEQVEEFKTQMESAWETYQKLLAVGVRKEIARYVLPNACKTKIVVSANFREWRHIIKLRTSKRAQPEMQVVAKAIRDILVAKAPKVFGDL